MWVANEAPTLQKDPCAAMSLSTEYCRYVGEWSTSTDPTYIENNNILARLRADVGNIMKVCDYAAYRDWWDRNGAELNRCANDIVNHRDNRLLYYCGHPVAIRDEYWDAFAEWAAAKGYSVYKEMPLWHSMTAWTDGGKRLEAIYLPLSLDEYTKASCE